MLLLHSVMVCSRSADSYDAQQSINFSFKDAVGLRRIGIVIPLYSVCNSGGVVGKLITLANLLLHILMRKCN